MSRVTLSSLVGSALLFSGCASDSSVELLGSYSLWHPAESAEFDATNSRIYYGNAFMNQINYIDASNIDAIIDGNVTAVENAFDFDNNTEVFLAGMYTNGESLYVNGFFSGVVFQFDIATMSLADTISIMYDSALGIPAFLNGMCIDPSDSNALYVTDTGFNVTTFAENTDYGMIYKIDLATGDYSKVYDNSETPIYPNGCIMDDDGVLYVVEVARAVASRLIVWDSNGDDSWSFYDLNNTGDGIIITDDGDLYFTGFGNGDQPDALFQLIYDEDNDAYTQVLVLSDLEAPADICYDSTNDLIVIPTLNSEDWAANELLFVSVDDGDDSGEDSDSAISSFNVASFGQLMTLAFVASMAALA